MKLRAADESVSSFLDRLANETAHAFRRSPEAQAIRGVVFLHVNRALEAQASLEESAGALGIAVARAKLTPDLEKLAYDELETIGPLLSSQYDATLRPKNVNADT